jgi:thiol:disulfide interchange protein DsbD
MFESIFSYFWVSFGFGLLSLLNPCVFPLIPFTVSAFTPKEGAPKKNYLLESVIYSLGIIFTFSILGIFFSLFFGASGITKLATNPFLNFSIGIIFLFFAYALIGFDFLLPSSLVLFYSKLENVSGSGYLSILIKGFIISIATFTCTMPFVGSILVTASKGEWFFPLIGMFGYGLAFSIPFTLLSLFPMILERLPKNGKWNAKFRGILGIFEIIASLKFFSNADLIWGFNILSREIFLGITIILLVINTLYTLDLFEDMKNFYNQIKKISKYQISLSIIFVSLIIYLSFGITGSNLGELEAYLPPKQNNDSDKSTELVWMEDLDIAKSKAIETGKPILINFTGVICMNCRYMEENVLNTQEVKKELSKYILVELFTDRGTEKDDANQEFEEKKFGTNGIPYYAILDKNDKILSAHLGITRDTEEFINFLNLRKN